MCRNKDEGGRRCPGEARGDLRKAEQAALAALYDGSVDAETEAKLRAQVDECRRELVAGERRKTRNPVILNNLLPVEDEADMVFRDGVLQQVARPRVEVTREACDKIGLFGDDLTPTDTMNRSASFMNDVLARDTARRRKEGLGELDERLLRVSDGAQGDGQLMVQPTTDKDGKLAGFRISTPREAALSHGKLLLRHHDVSASGAIIRRCGHNPLGLEQDLISADQAGTFNGLKPGDSVVLDAHDDNRDPIRVKVTALAPHDGQHHLKVSQAPANASVTPKPRAVTTERFREPDGMWMPVAATPEYFEKQMGLPSGGSAAITRPKEVSDAHKRYLEASKAAEQPRDESVDFDTHMARKEAALTEQEAAYRQLVDTATSQPGPYVDVSSLVPGSADSVYIDRSTWEDMTSSYDPRDRYGASRQIADLLTQKANRPFTRLSTNARGFSLGACRNGNTVIYSALPDES